MKSKHPVFEDCNFSDCHEIIGDNLYLINCGAQIENTNEAVGGGVYFEESICITAGAVAEFLYNAPSFIMNQICSNSGMNKFVKFNYIELDGK